MRIREMPAFVFSHKHVRNAVICALLVCWAAGCAQTAEPQMPEKLRGLVAGKTHIACLEGYAADEASAAAKWK